ncbi:GNAT family N-acetyltransferase [Pseudacidobacterium ailaaui]|jgi:predicted GNAT superfamily acetyltransferase|uniref:GNAT family N-acetyltransferase n=1 Tax=Pseudacidobacterium ailaaui TaxID=1382359 RepID=UPI0005D20C8A|nr:GNAT family N-acetyltransferase [Pseudacidobacterium ailaaui]MDI3253705.1 GNAT family N-acetyltransferase [Bacillota bacterium]
MTFTTPQGRQILVRHCQGFEELDACVQLQIDVWGYSDGDVIPRRVFTVTQKIGGQVLGAFDITHGNQATPERLVGFAMAIPAVREPSSARLEPYLHSHMLAVNPEYRNSGIGRRLKLAQREDAVSRGFRLMEWTFDPLEIKNAFLNIHRLGAVVRRYTPNFYGVSSSRLQGGLPTDRLHAEWWMQSERVEAVLAGKAALPLRVEQTILVPREIYEWKSSTEDHARALEVQTRNRQLFLEAFQRGLAVIGFRTDAEGNGVYELGAWQEPR